MKPDPRNPNRMSDADKSRMKASLAEFGDLSGIVINRRTDQLIGGHQRADVLADGELHVDDLSEPEPDGTVARGHLEHDGKRYVVRVVDWDDEKAKAAIIAANRFGRVGADDPELLKSLLDEIVADGVVDTDLTGFDADALADAIEDREATLKTLDVKPPPTMAWVLIGVPIGKWDQVSAYAEASAMIEGSIVETTVNDQQD
jgi:hypothetical protein